jgi:hypothetical protein
MPLRVARTVKMVLAFNGALPKRAHPKKTTEEMIVGDIQYIRVP